MKHFKHVTRTKAANLSDLNSDYCNGITRFFFFSCYFHSPTSHECGIKSQKKNKNCFQQSPKHFLKLRHPRTRWVLMMCSCELLLHCLCVLHCGTKVCIKRHSKNQAYFSMHTDSFDYTWFCCFSSASQPNTYLETASSYCVIWNWDTAHVVSLPKADGIWSLDWALGRGVGLFFSNCRPWGQIRLALTR